MVHPFFNIYDDVQGGFISIHLDDVLAGRAFIDFSRVATITEQSTADEFVSVCRGVVEQDVLTIIIDTRKHRSPNDQTVRCAPAQCAAVNTIVSNSASSWSPYSCHLRAILFSLWPMGICQSYCNRVLSPSVVRLSSSCPIATTDERLNSATRAHCTVCEYLLRVWHS